MGTCGIYKKHIKNAEVQTIDIKRLNRIARKKNICCVGCGKRFFELLSVYEGEAFVSRINLLVDYNPSLQGKEIKRGNVCKEIQSYHHLSDVSGKNSIILITSDRWVEIFEKIKEYISPGISVFKYPTVYTRNIELFFKVGSFFICKRQLLFRAGEEPHENADEISRYLLEECKGKKYKVIYLGEEEKKASQIKYLDINSIRKKSSFLKIIDFCFTYARSKYLLYENEAIQKVNPKQVLIFLNHGTVPLKNVADVLHQPNEIDYATCPGEGCSNLYLEQYGIPYEKLVYMMPARVNRMLCGAGELHKIVKTNGKKVILWLPTFRQLMGTERKDSLNLNPINLLFENINVVDAVLGDYNLFLIIKKHPREKEQISVPDSVKNICVLEEESLKKTGMSLQELLKGSDALLTDYSGISFEYMLLNRPIGYVLSDIDVYQRGFAMRDYTKYMTGHKICSIEDLLFFFKAIMEGRDLYNKERNIIVNDLFGTHAFKNGAKEFECFLAQNENKDSE